MRIQFLDCTLDSNSRQLVRNGGTIHVSPKAFDLLCYLIEHRPNAVSKADLHTRMWPSTFVGDANLSVLVAELRRALGDDPHTPRYLRTVHKIGYAFCADAVQLSDRRASEQSHRVWLAWNDHVQFLTQGENVIGRDPSCSIWLDLPGVSRRHATILVRDETALLDDMGSTNGTFVGGAQIKTTQPIRDGDVIRIGAAELRFRMCTHTVETERLAR